MTDVALFARGALADLPAATMAALLERTPADSGDLTAQVAAVMTDVRVRGDAALIDMADRFDGATLDAVEVPRAEWDKALESLDADVRSALERAAENIRCFHAAQLPDDVVVDVEPGVRITRVWVPLESAGVYAPGGRAAYPSSVLMGVVPAKAVGVSTVIVCSPPGPDGAPPEEVLAACAIAGADRLFAVGGAGAVAAMAYGTESVRSVDAIVGPGNRWLTEAKRQIAGEVLIDSPAGPSEVLVVADAGADPELIAAEMLAQAEYDPDAASVLVTDSQQLADDTLTALNDALADAPRGDIIRSSLSSAGAVLVTESLDAAFDFAQQYAPEHLSVMTRIASSEARRVTTAGTTFVGDAASVAFGDYLTGANHVLPTAGRARAFSGLSAQHFLRSYTIQEVDAAGAASMSADVVTLATAEGLPAHAAAAARRST